MIRTTWHSRMDFLSGQANAMSSEIAKTNERIATGKRINRASDDPGRISQLHGVREELANQGVYSKNAGQGEQLLVVADTALKDIHRTLTEAREIAIQFANESYNPGQRIEASNIIDSLFERALSLSNVQFEERHIFAGTAYDEPAYDSTGTYQGGTDEPETVVGDDLTIKTGFDGSSMLTDTSDMFAAFDNLKAALAADDTATIRATLDEIDDALTDVEEGMVDVGGQMRRAEDALDLAGHLGTELRQALANAEETSLIDAYSQLIQLQTNFDAAMQVIALQRYTGLFTRI